MNSIVLNLQGSKIAPIGEAFCIRIAYLLSDSVQSVGEGLIAFEDWFVPKSYKTKAGISMQHFIKHTNDDEESQNLVNNIKTALLNYQEMKKVKYKNSNHIKAIKLAEQFIDKAFEATKSDLKNWVDQIGFGNLNPLLKTAHLGCICIPRNDDDENKKPTYTIKEIFVPNETPENYKTDIFCLPMEFYLLAISESMKINDVDDAEAENEDAICMAKCFELPNINPCASAELNGIRQDIEPGMIGWRQKIDRWLDIAKEKPESALTYLKENLLPEMSNIGSTINNQIEVEQYSRHSGMVAELHIGLMPMNLLLDVYFRLGVLNDEERQQIEMLLMKNDGLKNRWPFIAIRNMTDIEELNSKLEVTKITATKKSLNID